MVYSCGAVVINDRLFVYYGGADTVVCVASAKLGPFIEQLVTNHKETKPESRPLRTMINKEGLPEPVQGYCLKCRRMGEIKNPHYVVINLRHAIQGVCPWCGGKIETYKIEIGYR